MAAQRLEIAQFALKRGRGDIFQVTELQNRLVLTQNEEVNAKIEFLDAVANLEQAIGLTLETWKEAISTSGLLN